MMSGYTERKSLVRGTVKGNRWSDEIQYKRSHSLTVRRFDSDNTRLGCRLFTLFVALVFNVELRTVFDTLLRLLAFLRTLL